MENYYRKIGLLLVIAVLHFAIPLYVTNFLDALYGGMVLLAIFYVLYYTINDAVLFKKTEKVVNILLCLVAYVVTLLVFVYLIHKDKF